MPTHSILGEADDRGVHAPQEVRLIQNEPAVRGVAAPLFLKFRRRRGVASTATEWALPRMGERGGGDGPKAQRGSWLGWQATRRQVMAKITMRESRKPATKTKNGQGVSMLVVELAPPTTSDQTLLRAEAQAALDEYRELHARTKQARARAKKLTQAYERESGTVLRPGE